MNHAYILTIKGTHADGMHALAATLHSDAAATRKSWDGHATVWLVESDDDLSGQLNEWFTRDERAESNAPGALLLWTPVRYPESRDDPGLAHRFDSGAAPGSTPDEGKDDGILAGDRDRAVPRGG